jgi:hypothetical protein
VTPTGLGTLRKRLPKCRILPDVPAPVHLTAGDRKALAWAVERGAAEVAVVHYNDFGRGFVLKKSKLLSQFAECKRLEILYLGTSHKTTDEELKALRLPPSVTELFLRDGIFTDAGLRHLERFGHLRRLHLIHNRKLSAKAVEALSKALPKTLIHSVHGNFLAGTKQ